MAGSILSNRATRAARGVTTALGVSLALLTTSADVHAQGVERVRQIVSISPLSIVFGVFGAEYERRLGTASSLGVSGSFYRQTSFTYTSGEVKYRYYPQERALEGFSVGVTGGLTQVSSRETSSDESGTAASVGVSLDYQWLLGPRKRFALALGTGARRLIVLGTRLDGAALTLPTARISIGRGF
jgi:hypothetical protein